MSRNADLSRKCSQVTQHNFIKEIQDVAAFYEGRIPLAWQDALQDVLDTVEKGPGNATD